MTQSNVQSVLEKRTLTIYEKVKLLSSNLYAMSTKHLNSFKNSVGSLLYLAFLLSIA